VFGMEIFLEMAILLSVEALSTIIISKFCVGNEDPYRLSKQFFRYSPEL